MEYTQQAECSTELMRGVRCTRKTHSSCCYGATSAKYFGERVLPNSLLLPVSVFGDLTRFIAGIVRKDGDVSNPWQYSLITTRYHRTDQAHVRVSARFLVDLSFSYISYRLLEENWRGGFIEDNSNNEWTREDKNTAVGRVCTASSWRTPQSRWSSGSLPFDRVTSQSPHDQAHHTSHTCCFLPKDQFIRPKMPASGRCSGTGCPD